MYFRLSFNHSDSADCSRQRTKYLLFPCFNFLWHFTCRLHIHIFYIAFTCFFLCISLFFFCFARLFMKLILLHGERSLSLSPAVCVPFVTSWHRRYVKNLPQGYCLLPETKTRKRAQKQTNFSITRWGGSLLLLLLLLLLVLLLASAHLADATFCCLSLSLSEVFLEYRHQIKPKRGKILKTYRVHYLMFLELSARIIRSRIFIFLSAQEPCLWSCDFKFQLYEIYFSWEVVLT